MLDISIIVLYLILTLAYRIYRGKGIKNFKDYALGKRNIGMFALTATIAATLVGGGGTISKSMLCYSFGAVCLAVYLTVFSIGFLQSGLFLDF